MIEPRIRRRPVPAHGPWPAHWPDVLRRVYAARGVGSGEDAELRLARLLPPDSLGGLESAVAMLATAIARDRHIVVVGDFDCDGATGTAVAVRGLRLLGARRVGYRVPNRRIHGYGLSAALVEELAPMAPDLVLTVDSGIACHEGVAAARARGWQVLVTDHHLPGATLPAADAIVNPNLDGDAFPSKALAGVGVVFYLLLALRRHLRLAGGDEISPPDLSVLLDLVAVGTVADLVPLDLNNRLLVSAGLRRLREGKGQVGLLALAEVSGRVPARLTAADIGFAIGPRLNAAGRLDDMALGIECLLADDLQAARAMAQALDRINTERRSRQQAMVDEAESVLGGLSGSPSDLPPSLVLAEPAWHPGIVGLVASRIKDHCQRPTIAFAPAEAGSDTLRGSARSVPGFHIRDALAAIAALHPGLIERFGGHAMAAGLSLRADRLDAFRKAWLDWVAPRLTPDLLQAELVSDGPLEEHEMSRDLAERLRLAGPWGQGFPEPTFDDDFDVLEWRQLGDRHLKMQLRRAGGRRVVPAIHFGGWRGRPPPERIRVVYQLEPDHYRGRGDIQLLVRHWLPA